MPAPPPVRLASVGEQPSSHNSFMLVSADISPYITHFYQTSHIVHISCTHPHPRLYTQPTMSVPWRKHTTHPPTPPSYPSSFGTADSDIDSGSDSGDTDAELDAMVQEEWEESLRQMEVVISIIVIPYFGKWFGRQWAFWGTLLRRWLSSTVPCLTINEQRTKDINESVSVEHSSASHSMSCK